MRTLLIGGVVAVVLTGLWLMAARSLSMLLDKVSTIPLASEPAAPFSWNGVFLQFGQASGGADGPKGPGGPVLDLQGPGPGYAEVATLAPDAEHRLVLTTHGGSFVIGLPAGSMPDAETPPQPVPVYAAEPGDIATLTTERSRLSWPVFELNFMTGQSPTWRRHLYYRLSWKKPSGARLDMLWRFEQGYYTSGGWLAPGTRDGVTGLMQANVQAAPSR